MSLKSLTFSMFLPQGWLALPSEFQGTTSYWALCRQYYIHTQKECRGGGRGWWRVSSFALLFIREESSLQNVPGDFPSISIVKIGSYALPLVVRMAGMQDSHTFSFFIGRWALPAGSQPVVPASYLYPYPLHSCS